MNIYHELHVPDHARRERIYAGEIYIYNATPSALRLRDLARQLLDQAFDGRDPLRIHEIVTVEQCIQVLSVLKPKFIHNPKAKEYIRELLKELDCDLEKTYFDVPRLRTAFPGDYLRAGIAYAFHPHRDTWYSAPMCQINWWIPVYDITPENSMAFHPKYFARPILNGSSSYNYQQWNQQNRFTAAEHTKVDTRPQPRPEEAIELHPDVRVLTAPGGVTIFSAAQLHSTVPNTSGVARYSIDFRTVHIDDAFGRKGAANVDAACTGTTIGDYLRAKDLSHLPSELYDLYEAGTPITRVSVAEKGFAV